MARTILRLDGDVLDTKVERNKRWAQSLYDSVVSEKLHEHGRSNISDTWINAGSHAICGRLGLVG